MATNEVVEEEKRYAMIVPLPQAQGLVENRYGTPDSLANARPGETCGNSA